MNVRKQKRILALLELNKGKTFESVCELLNVSTRSAQRWANCFSEDRLTFLDDKPRSGRPIGLSGEAKAKITALACSDAPEGYARWSLRLLADKVVELDIVDSISFKQVGNILKKMNCSRTGKGSGAFAK